MASPAWLRGLGECKCGAPLNVGDGRRFRELDAAEEKRGISGSDFGQLGHQYISFNDLNIDPVQSILRQHACMLALLNRVF